MHSREKNSKFEIRNSKLLRFAPECQRDHQNPQARFRPEAFSNADRHAPYGTPHENADIPDACRHFLSIRVYQRPSAARILKMELGNHSFPDRFPCPASGAPRGMKMVSRPRSGRSGHHGLGGREHGEPRNFPVRFFPLCASASFLRVSASPRLVSAVPGPPRHRESASSIFDFRISNFPPHAD